MYYFFSLKDLKVSNSDDDIKEALIQVFKRYAFFSEEIGLLAALEEPRHQLQKEIMNNYSSFISESFRKVSNILIFCRRKIR